MKPVMDATARILVTGANGFVGRHLIAHLLAEEADSRILAAVHGAHAQELSQPAPDFPEAAGWPGGDAGGRIRADGLDVCDAGQVDALLQEFCPQQIYHLAARASGADADREALFAVNVGGTRHVLEAAARLSELPRVLLVSTGYVYGNTDPEHPAREEDPLAPTVRYGLYTDSKIEMEAVARDFPGLALIVRAFAHTGPGQIESYAVPAFARQLARIERGLEPPVLRVGNLEARRDLLDVRDVVCAYALLMRHGVSGRVYNVASGRPIRMREVLDRLRGFCPVTTEVTVDPARLRPADIACSTGDASRLRAETGWQPSRTLDQTLRATLDYWRAQKSGLPAGP